MSENQSKNQAESVDTGVPLPLISYVVAKAPSTLIVTWGAGRRAGQVERIDVKPIIASYKIFRPLRKNSELFETAKTIDDGNAVAWDGDDLELSAEAIEQLAEQTMTPEQFGAFMQRHNLIEPAIAAILGYSRRQIGYFKSTGPIPRVVALACKGYEKEKLDAEMGALLNKMTIHYQHQDQQPLPRPKVRAA